jgi:hypothetical protein
VGVVGENGAGAAASLPLSQIREKKRSILEGWKRGRRRSERGVCCRFLEKSGREPRVSTI